MSGELADGVDAGGTAVSDTSVGAGGIGMSEQAATWTSETRTMTEAWVAIGNRCYVRAGEVVAVSVFCVPDRRDDDRWNYGAGWLTSRSVVELRNGRRFASPLLPATIVRRLVSVQP
jgi:hypothetical protein